jgi:SAM-dependent methyltransferase
MPLAYYSRSATAEFWSEHWRAHSLDTLIRAAEASPLTELILRALPPAGVPVLEAGCGLGQYVILLRRHGYAATGVDWSPETLSACRAEAAGTPLSVMDLRRLGFRSGAFAVYLSLGVVEHDPEGPDHMLREAWRVLRPGGVLILSVPYVNFVRRLGAWWIRGRNRRLRETGGQFYQFAFSQAEADAFVERNGFRVLTRIPYDPGRLVRKSGRVLMRALRAGAAAPAEETDGRGGRGKPAARRPSALSARVRNALRGVLYSWIGLHSLGHMILFTAVKR